MVRLKLRSAFFVALPCPVRQSLQALPSDRTFVGPKILEFLGRLSWSSSAYKCGALFSDSRIGLCFRRAGSRLDESC